MVDSQFVYIVVSEEGGIIGVFRSEKDADDQVQDLEDFAKSMGHQPEEYWIEHWKVL